MVLKNTIAKMNNSPEGPHIHWGWQRKESGHGEISTEVMQSETQRKKNEHLQERTTTKEERI